MTAASATNAPASRWRRALATLIDAALVPPLTVLLVMIGGVVEHAEDFVDNLWMLQVLGLAIAAYLLLNGVLLWRHGQTVGKRVLGISVRQAANPQAIAPLWKLVLIRAWFFAALFVVVVPWLAWLPLLDHLLCLRRGRRCGHDHLAGTVVVQQGD